jgi:DNA mismatch repair protein MutL
MPITCGTQGIANGDLREAIADELESNGFEVEPFGPQTLAVKASPIGLEGAALERMLAEVIDQSSADSDEAKAES